MSFGEGVVGADVWGDGDDWLVRVGPASAVVVVEDSV